MNFEDMIRVATRLQSGGVYRYPNGDVIDRSSFALKSAAASRRENEAKQMFDTFLAELAAADNSDAEEGVVNKYPLTQEVVPPSTHLTAICWKEFKRHVTATGCNAKRRLISDSEKQALPKAARKKGKMHSVMVTVPVHPSKLADDMEAKKIKKAAAEQRKKERAELRAAQNPGQTAL